MTTSTRIKSSNRSRRSSKAADERFDRATVVAAIVVRNDRVLMIRRTDGRDVLRWHFPGGAVESGELPRSAVAREVAEETGVTCSPQRRLTRRRHPQTGVDIEYWLTKYLSGTPEVRESDKADRVLWVPASEVSSIVDSDLAPRVAQYLAGFASATARERLRLRLSRP